MTKKIASLSGQSAATEVRSFHKLTASAKVTAISNRAIERKFNPLVVFLELGSHLLATLLRH
jgi:hypothetical protein